MASDNSDLNIIILSFKLMWFVLFKLLFWSKAQIDFSYMQTYLIH